MGKAIVATDADGLVDVLTPEHDAVIVPKRDARGAVVGDGSPDRRAGHAGAAVGGGADQRAPVRHRHVRRQDAAALRPAAPRVASDSPPGRARRRSLVSHEQGAGMTREVDGGAGAGRGAVVQAGPDPRCRDPDRLRQPGRLHRLPAGLERHPQRRSDLLHDGAQPRRRRRPDLSQGGPRPGLAGIPVGAVRPVPEEGHRHPRCRADAAAAVRMAADAGRSGPVPAVLRQVVRLPAGRGAVREAVRHQRLPGAARAPDVAGGAVQLPVPARAHAGVDGGAARRRVRAGQHRSGVLRLDRAGSLQLRAGPARLLLLALQGGRAAVARHAAHRSGC